MVHAFTIANVSSPPPLDTSGIDKGMKVNAKPSTLRRSAFWVTALSILPHIFCCMLPAVAALISLGTTVGLGTALAASPLYAFVDAWHAQLLALAFASVLFSGTANYIAYRMDCHTHGSCTHGSCTPRKRASLKLFWASLFLLALDVMWYTAEVGLLHLHQH